MIPHDDIPSSESQDEYDDQPDEVFRKIKNETGFSRRGAHAEYSLDTDEMAQMLDDYDGEIDDEEEDLMAFLGNSKRTIAQSMAKHHSGDISMGAEAFDIDDTSFAQIASPSAQFFHYQQNQQQQRDNPFNYNYSMALAKSHSSDDDASADQSVHIGSSSSSSAKPIIEKISSRKAGEKGGIKLTAKEKNREHAKNTRIRKKNYLEALKDSIRVLTEDRERVERDRKVSLSRLLEQATVRKKVLADIMNFRVIGMLDRNVWATLVDENVEVVLPITPYRSFPPSEVCFLPLLSLFVFIAHCFTPS